MGCRCQCRAQLLRQLLRVGCSVDDLFHFGNNDPYIPNEGVDEVAAGLAGHPGFSLNVENAGHAFDNHESDVFYNEAAANSAWSKTMAFLSSHVPA